MTEVWKPIPNWDGYEVSSKGNVRSYRQRGRNRGLSSKQHLLKPSATSRWSNRGYLGVTFPGNKRISIHRLVMLAFAGPCPDGMEVCHNDSNPRNNNLDNLRYDTPQNNNQDRCPLTNEQVVNVRERRARGETIALLATEHGISKESMRNLCSGKTFVQAGGPHTPGKTHGNAFDANMFICCHKATKEQLKERAEQLGLKSSVIARWALRWAIHASREELIMYSIEPESGDDQQ